MKEDYSKTPIPESIHEREWYVAQVMPKTYMLVRWQKINYTPPKEKQLKLF